MAGTVSTLMLRLMGDDSGAEQAMDGVGASAGKLIGTLAGVATAALGIGAAFGAALEVASVQGSIAGKLGVSAGEAKELGHIAGSIYANAWGDSLSAVSDALIIVKQDLNDLAAPEELEGITTKALALADAFGIDVGQAVQGVGQLIRTGLVADANEGLDLITLTLQTMGQRGDDVLDTLKEYPVAFQALGLSGEQAIGLMKQGLAGGARDTDQVADALKEFKLIASSGSKDAAAGFKALGLDAQKMTAIFAKGGPGAAAGLDQVLDRIRQMKDPLKQNAAAVALFGTPFEDMQAALYALDPSKAAEGLGKVAGAADKMVAAVGTSPQATLESFKRKVEIALGESLAKSVPAMQGALDKFAPMIPQIVGGLTTVLGVAVPILTSVLGFIAPYAPVLTQIAIAAVGVKVAMMAWGAISSTVTAVRTSVQAASTAMAMFRAGMAGAQATQMASAGQRLALMFGTMTRNIGMATVAVGRWIATQAVAAAGAIRTAAGVVAQNVAMAAQATWGGIIRVATLLWTGVQWLLNASFYGFPLVWIIAAIVAVVAIIVLIATKTTWFQDIWNFIWNAVVAYFTFVVGIIKGAVAGLIFIFGTWLPGVIQGAVSNIVGIWNGFWGFINGLFTGILRLIMGFGRFIFVTLPVSIGAGIGKMIGQFNNFAISVLRFFLSIPARIGTIGRDIVVGLWNGISGMGAWLWQQVSGFASNILTTMMDAIGAHSPSRKAADLVGKPIPQGVAKGMIDNMGAVDKAALMVAGAAIPNAGTLAAASRSASAAAGGGAAGGGDITLVINTQLDAATIAQVLLKYNRRTGALKELART